MRQRKPKADSRREPAEAGRRKPSLWALGGLTPLELARRVLLRFFKGEIFTRAAALSFYFIFALFPMIVALLAVVGLFAQNNSFRTGMIAQFGRIMPPSALALVETTVREISAQSGGWKVGLGLVLALWSASGGMSALMDALDFSYRVQESRPYLKRKAIAVGLTLAIVLLSSVDLGIVLYGGSLAEFVGQRTGLSHAMVTLWQLADWPIALLLVLFSLALIYCLGPDVRPRLRLITPGSVVGGLVWIIASLLLRVYLHFFNTYTRSYGSLGAVMVLLLWLYITGLAILLGGEINAEIEAAQAAV
jgi:membrane protein